MNAPETAAVAALSTTPDLFITVPQVTLPNGTVVPSFRVGQYVCTQGTDGKAAVTAEDAPWVRINFEEAKAACIAAGYALITELQWLAIAWDAALVAANWNTGIVGRGRLAQGLRQGTVDSAQPGTYQPEDPDEQRWLTLSNGERICDLNGNVYQWVFDNVQGDEQGLIAREFAKDSPSITTPPFPSGTKGMGDYETWDWSGAALIRGGYWDSEARAGAFHLDRVWPDFRYDLVGFRCTQPIGL